MKLFAENRIEDLFKEKDAEIDNYLKSMSDETIITADTNDLANDIVNRYSISCDLEIITKNVEPRVYMVRIPTTALLPEQRMFARESHYEVAAVDYTFGLKGNSKLLRYQPTTYDHWSIESSVNNSSLTITIVTSYANLNLSEQTEQLVTSTIQTTINKIQQNISNIRANCEKYNSDLLGRVTSCIEETKRRLNIAQEQKGRLNPFK